MKNYRRLFLVDGDSFIYKALSGIHRLGEDDKVLIFVAAEELRQRLKAKGYVRSNVNVILVRRGKETVDNRIKGFLGNVVNREDRGQIFIISRDHGYCKRMDYYRKKYGIPADELELKKSIQAVLQEKDYKVLTRRTAKKAGANGRGGGYIGRSMSVNARRAYERGLKPLSRIRAADLRQNGFGYSVAFFRWLVHHWDIRPRERHHTSASCRITAFYDGSVIRYAARCCNLELLFRIYKGKITVEQARRERGICYARARILGTLFGGKSGEIVSANCIFCDNLLFLSPKLCVRADHPGVEVVETYEDFEETPQNMRDEKLERLAAELVKHKTSVYKKYLKE